jgi:hypothetical protein
MSQYTANLAVLNKTGNMEQPGALPNRGVSTGMAGFDAMGMDCQPDATNSLGKLGQTVSDPYAESCPGAMC